MLTVASIFRDSTFYLHRYLDQIQRLRYEVDDVRCLWAEGDSVDGTYDRLEQFLRPGDILIKVDHGGPNFGSIDHPQRWDQIATVVRRLLDEWDGGRDGFVWVESDLVWEPETVVALVERARPALAPMVFHGHTDRYYDTWGFRKDGAQFAPWPPYFQGNDGTISPIDSCGSCFALTPDAYDTVKNWSGHWPFTAGGQLAVDPTLEVRHP